MTPPATATVKTTMKRTTLTLTLTLTLPLTLTVPAPATDATAAAATMTAKTEKDPVNKMLSTTAANDVGNISTSVELCQDFENATLMDVTLDDKVKPTGVWSQSWSKMPLKSGLRCVAKTFDVTGLQAKRKD